MPNGRSWPIYRTVVLDEDAQSFVDAQLQAGNRFDEQWRGIEWLICRTPNVGLPRDREAPNRFVLLVIAGSDLAETMEVWLLYSFDDTQVTVHAVRFGEE